MKFLSLNRYTIALRKTAYKINNEVSVTIIVNGETKGRLSAYSVLIIVQETRQKCRWFSTFLHILNKLFFSCFTCIYVSHNHNIYVFSLQDVAMTVTVNWSPQ